MNVTDAYFVDLSSALSIHTIRKEKWREPTLSKQLNAHGRRKLQYK